MQIFKYGDKIETKDSCLPKLTGTVLGQNTKTGLVKFRCRERNEIMSCYPENIQHRPVDDPRRSHLTTTTIPVVGEWWEWPQTIEEMACPTAQSADES